MELAVKKKAKREVYKLLAYGSHEEKLEAEDVSIITSKWHSMSLRMLC